MQEVLTNAVANLNSPPVLFFALGLFLGVVKSDLQYPREFSKILSIYLMMAIGFKGGVELSQSALQWSLITYSVLAIGFSFSLPFVGYALLKASTKLSNVDCAGIAAHYGSVSVVTFVAALSFVEFRQLEYDRALLFLLVLMEGPALLSALMLKEKSKIGVDSDSFWRKLNWKEILLSGSVILLLGSLLIGVVSGKQGQFMVKDFLVTPFKGVLCLFLLDMGIQAGSRLHHFQKAGPRLFAFGIYMPLIGGSLGVAAAVFCGMNVGSATLFGVLAGSASYIVIPAALKIALPEANAGLFLPLSLGVTFPFNLLFGIPYYYFLSDLISALISSSS